MNFTLVLIGSPGAGKTSVLWGLSTLLERAGVAHGLLESEGFSQGWPPLPDQAASAQLAAAIATQRAAGRALILVTATTETAAQLDAVIAAADPGEIAVICLTAPPELSAARVAEREPDTWAGKPALVSAAARLAVTIPQLPGIDHVISTADRAVDDVAAEVLGLIPGNG